MTQTETFREAVRTAIRQVIDSVDDLGDADPQEYLTLLVDVTRSAKQVALAYDMITPATRKREIVGAIRIAVRAVELDIPGLPGFLEVLVLNLVLRDVLPVLYDILTA